MNGDYSPRYYAVNGRPMTMMEWSRSFSHYRHIGLDLLRIRGHRYRVSTVWLGLDHNWRPHGPPLIFETMAFIDDDIGRPRIFEDMQYRYSTLVQAQRGHIRIVRSLKRIVRTMPRHPQLIHKGRKPVGRPTKRK